MAEETRPEPQNPEGGTAVQSARLDRWGRALVIIGVIGVALPGLLVSIAAILAFLFVSFHCFGGGSLCSDPAAGFEGLFLATVALVLALVVGLNLIQMLRGKRIALAIGGLASFALVGIVVADALWIAVADQEGWLFGAIVPLTMALVAGVGFALGLGATLRLVAYRNRAVGWIAAARADSTRSSPSCGCRGIGAGVGVGRSSATCPAG